MPRPEPRGRRMRRREFILLIGGAAATWPLGVRAQQSAIPVIGYLDVGSPEGSASIASAFRRGLAQTGQIEGGEPNRLLVLAVDHCGHSPSDTQWRRA
jgi:hypothetical protein